MLKRLNQNPYFLLAPTVLLLLVFSYYPFFSALGYAFFRWSYITRPPEFAGMDNFFELFRDGDLWVSFLNMLMLLVADILKVLIITTIVAELIFSLRSPKLAQFYRVALVLPMVVPGVVGLYIWASFYDYDTGLVNTILRPVEKSGAYHWVIDQPAFQWLRDMDAGTAELIDEERALRREVVAEVRDLPPEMAVGRVIREVEPGPDEEKIQEELPVFPPMLAALVAGRAELEPEQVEGLAPDLRARILRVNSLDEEILSKRNVTLDKSWLGDEDTALGAFIFMGFPWCGGIAVLIVLAGLYSIPQDIFDCAKVDGIGPIRRVFLIDIHLIAGQLKLLVVMAMLGTIQGFMGQMILTDGGPGNATLVPALHLIHHAFKYRNLGYGAAIAVLLFLIMLTLTFINMRYIKTSEEVV